MPVDFQPIDFQPTPSGGVDFQPSTQPQKQPSALETLWNKAKSYYSAKQAQAEADRQQILAHPFKSLMSAVGNTGLGVPAVGNIPYLPNQTVAGAAKGISDLVLAPAQVAAHISGIGVPQTDNAVNATGNFFRNNFDKSTAGEVAGQSLATLVPVGGGALGRLAQYAALPVLTTPETNLNGDFGTRKAIEAGSGVALGGASELASKLLTLAKPTLRTVAKAERPEQIISDMRTNYEGTPPQALRASTQENLAAGISSARQKYAPGDALTKEIQVDLSPAADELAATLAAYRKSGRIQHPEQIQALEAYEKRWRKLGSTSWEDAAGILSDLKATFAELQSSGAKRIDKKPFDNAATALADSMTSASPEGMRLKGEGDQSWVKDVAPHFSPTAKAMRNAPNDATALDILTSLRPGPTKRMDNSAVTDLAKAGGIEPIVDDWISNALERSGGNPRVFQTNLKPGLESLRLIDPELAARVEATLKVAGYSAPFGMLANVGASKIPGVGTAGTVGASFSPAYAGPGLSWRALQSGPVRGTAGAMAQAPTGQPANAFQSLVSQYLPWNQR